MAALFVALGGTGYAVAKLPRNSVGTPQLKKNAVIGSKVKNNAIRGADVNEATLGQVPSAANAEALDGLDSTAFQRRLAGSQSYSVPATALQDGNAAGRSSLLHSFRWCAAFGIDLPIDFFGAVHLPQGATITGLHVSYIDADGPPDSNGTVFLDREPVSGPDAPGGSIVSVNLFDTNPEGQNATASASPVSSSPASVVDNSAYFYVLEGAMNEGSALVCAVRVTYDLPAG